MVKKKKNKKEEETELSLDYVFGRSAEALDAATIEAAKRQDLEGMFTASQMWLNMAGALNQTFGQAEPQPEEEKPRAHPFGFGVGMEIADGTHTAESESEPGGDEESRQL